MTVTPTFIKMLDMYMGKKCKVVYRDGGVSARSKAFYGVLKGFDDKFQTWEGGNEPNGKEKLAVSFNHDDVSRIVLEVGNRA